MQPAVDALKDWLSQSAPLEQDGPSLQLILHLNALPGQPSVSLALESSSALIASPPASAPPATSPSVAAELDVILRLTLADFSRHRVGSLAFESPSGAIEPPKPEVLARLLAGGLCRTGPLGGGVIFVNACDTAVQARWLLQHGAPSVIFCPRRISDGAAAEFSRGFYEALASHLDVTEAYEQARHPWGRKTLRSHAWGWKALVMVTTIYVRLHAHPPRIHS